MTRSRCSRSPAPLSCTGGHGDPARRVASAVGRIPVASYPIFAGAASVSSPLAWIAANGIGVGPNPKGPDPVFAGRQQRLHRHFQYLPSIVRGDAGVLRFPSDAQVSSLTPVADRELVPTDSERPPGGTPIRADGPIKHVFFIVKENRTYDQVLGDVKRGDGDPALTLFGAGITPNEHALVARFPLLDHVYADSQVSIDGHYWTSSGSVPDYVVRNWPPNYAGRGRPLDFGAYEVAAPSQGRSSTARSPSGSPSTTTARRSPVSSGRDRARQGPHRGRGRPGGAGARRLRRAAVRWRPRLQRRRDAGAVL